MYENKFIPYTRLFDSLSGRWVNVPVEQEVYDVCDDKEEKQRFRRMMNWYAAHPEAPRITNSTSYEDLREQGADITDTVSLSVQEIAEELETLEFLHDAIRRLPNREHDVIDAYYFDGLSDQQISDITGIPQQTVNYRRNAGINYLKEFLE